MRIIRSGGSPPWDDLNSFIDAVIKQSKADLEEYSDAKRPTFFDRGLFDALSGFAARNKVPLESLLPDDFSFTQPVFYVPPWPEIFVNTAERRLSMAVAIEEADRIERDLIAMNIDYVEVPKTSPEARADFVLSYL